MTRQGLEGQAGTSVVLDFCLPCQAFWFDAYESLQLTPASTLRLFGEISTATGAPQRPRAPFAPCPRCHARLEPVHDWQRSTRFQYSRCPSGHGRLITFFDFLREKDFVRPLSPAQIAELRVHAQSVNCANCGAPIDLAASTACAHCGSPLSMFDLTHAEALVAQLKSAAEAAASPERRATLDIDLMRARQQAEHAFPVNEREGWARDAVTLGTVTAGLLAVARWLSEPA